MGLAPKCDEKAVHIDVPTAQNFDGLGSGAGLEYCRRQTKRWALATI
jgi:hypothetical protein